MKAAVVYRDEKILNEVREFLTERNIESAYYSKPERELEDFDFIISIGGDGTILRILQKLRKCPPIFGINTGRVGLLTHSTPSNFREKLNNALEKFEIEKFMRLSCLTDGGEFLALNEIAVFNREVAKLVSISVKVDGVPLENLRCDGILVSTQIGSTGYALSAGGPLVDPYLESIIVIPVAPFKIGWRPWIFNSSRSVVLEIEGESVVIADGQKNLEIDGKITIKKSDYPAIFFKKENRIKEISEKIKTIE
jgi:NAD+ kinase